MARHHNPVLGSISVESKRSYDRSSLSQYPRAPRPFDTPKEETDASQEESLVRGAGDTEVEVDIEVQEESTP
jgi:hypothetical protein